jgi:hypothetical protein
MMLLLLLLLWSLRRHPFLQLMLLLMPQNFDLVAFFFVDNG